MIEFMSVLTALFLLSLFAGALLLIEKRIQKAEDKRQKKKLADQYESLREQYLEDKFNGT